MPPVVSTAKGMKVGVLSGGDDLVLGLLALGGVLSDCEDLGTGYRKHERGLKDEN